MIQYLKLFTLLLLLAICPSIVSAQLGGAHSDLIVIDKRDSIYSTVVVEGLNVLVYVPQSASVPGKKFPVV